MVDRLGVGECFAGLDVGRLATPLGCVEQYPRHAIALAAVDSDRTDPGGKRVQLLQSRAGLYLARRPGGYGGSTTDQFRAAFGDPAPDQAQGLAGAVVDCLPASCAVVQAGPGGAAEIEGYDLHRGWRTQTLAHHPGAVVEQRQARHHCPARRLDGESDLRNVVGAQFPAQRQGGCGNRSRQIGGAAPQALATRNRAVDLHFGAQLGLAEMGQGPSHGSHRLLAVAGGHNARAIAAQLHPDAGEKVYGAGYRERHVPQHSLGQHAADAGRPGCGGSNWIACGGGAWT